MQVSIQSQILVPYPIVNEPGYDSRENSAQSAEYNAQLRLETMRQAMLAHLRNPPVGFESAVARHFKEQRERVLAQCWQWTREVSAITSAKQGVHHSAPFELSAHQRYYLGAGTRRASRKDVGCSGTASFRPTTSFFSSA